MMRTLLLSIFLTLTAHAELVGIKTKMIFREHQYLELETKCTLNEGFGCLALQVYFQGRPVSRPLTEEDFFLDTDDYGTTVELEAAPTLSCRGVEQLKWPARSHVNIRYCVNRHTNLILGKTYLVLQQPGLTFVDFSADKRAEFKRDLSQINLAHTYLRAIMFRDRGVLKSATQARQIAEFFEAHYGQD